MAWVNCRPSFLTHHSDELATCKSSSFDAAALAVLVTLIFAAVNVTAASFHVCVMSISGLLVVTVAPDNVVLPVINVMSCWPVTSTRAEL